MCFMRNSTKEQDTEVAKFMIDHGFPAWYTAHVLNRGSNAFFEYNPSKKTITRDGEVIWVE